MALPSAPQKPQEFQEIDAGEELAMEIYCRLAIKVIDDVKPRRNDDGGIEELQARLRFAADIAKEAAAAFFTKDETNNG